MCPRMTDVAALAASGFVLLGASVCITDRPRAVQAWFS
jgi:hypothetical protein